MKEKRINYLVDKFVDEYGDLRNFVICAVSYEFNEEYVTAYDELGNEDVSRNPYTKGLKVGYAICRPKYIDKDGVVYEDKFDEDLGCKIALGRARKNEEFALLAMYDGDINTDVVDAFLKRKSKYFKNNPEIFIAGYKRKK